jgi:nicotinate-nucleotide adenylyltransferase
MGWAAAPARLGTMSQRLGLMGGTLNPVHWGHLVLAEAAREAFDLAEVIWIPAGDPPHKPDADLAPQEHRFAMTELAIAGNPHFRASRLELDRPGPSYTLDTLRHFHAQGHAPDDLHFITGSDTMRDFLTWHRPAEVIQAARFVVAERPGCPFESLREILPPEFLPRIVRLPAPLVEFSSTEIRTRLRAGRSIRYRVPPSVEDYLRGHRLYLAAASGAR